MFVILMAKKRVNDHSNSKEKINFDKLTFGQRLADRVTTFGGSWAFIISFFIFLLVWVLVNSFWLSRFESWDPYPFVFLNLILACLVSLQAPMILMSQNRHQERDRAKAEKDYMINRKAEREIEIIQKELRAIKRLVCGKKGRK